MKKLLFLLIIVGVISLSTNVVSAAGLTQSQVNAIIGLLQSFGASQSVIENVQVSLSGGTPSISNTPTVPTPPATPTIATIDCVRFSHNLYLGQSDKETDSEVSKLQKFLKDSGHFTYPTITGYYGPATELAVQKFQAAQSIVSAGSYETTGYGVVGPKTQNKIYVLSCGNNVNNQTPTNTTTTSVVNQTAPSVPAVPQPTDTTANTTYSGTFQISNISAIPTLNSVQIEWNTNKPANSKVFLTGGSLSSKVYNSESGFSTRHVVHISGLTSGTNYSYEIEAITNNQVAKSQGTFTTTPDEYNISAQPDKVSVAASGWNAINIKVSALKNGQIQANQSVTMITPDSGQNQTRSTNGVSTTGANDWNTTFSYVPKTVGTHTLVFSWNGVNRSINVEATQYIEVAPIISELSKKLPVVEVNSTDSISLGYFKVSKADENIIGEAYDVKYETDFSIQDSVKISKNGSIYSLSIIPKTNTYSLPVGIHTVTIKEVKVVGISSGKYYYVSGLPITFTFEIKDIPNLEIIPIKTTHTFIVPDYVKVGDPIQSPATNDIQGEIGLFKIKLKPNSAVSIVNCEIRFEGSDAYVGYLHVPGGNGDQCQAEQKKTIITVSNGETQDNISVMVYLKQAPRSQVRENQRINVYIDKLVVKDSTFGTTKSISELISFSFDFAR